MSIPVITVENLSKRYVLGRQRDQRDALRHVLQNAVQNPLRWLRLRRAQASAVKEDFWALKNITFQVNQGDAIGIVGRNGAGKSTLLKVLSRITEPTTGRIKLKGRVASLLEVGTGFHQELSGRENIYLNGAILGMTRAEVRAKFDEIVAFSEVEKFLDTPVKRYSSGMYVRLAFAVAAHLEPDILVVDEVLAVGDAAFQKKCLGRMNQVARGGRTVLFVSHNMAAVRALCTSAMLLDRGEIRASGGTEEVIAAYFAIAGSQADTELDKKPREGTGRIRATNIRTLGPDGVEQPAALAGQPVIFEVAYRAESPGSNFMVSIDICTMEGARVTTLWSGLQNGEFRARGNGVVYCRLDDVVFRPSTYALNIHFMSQTECFDFVRDAKLLHVESSDFYGTGRLPAGDHGPLMSRFSWSDESPAQGAEILDANEDDLSATFAK